MIANTPQRAKSFNRAHRKIGAYVSPPNVFTSRVMSTIITHAHSHPTGYMCLDLSSPHGACRKRKLKRNGEEYFDSYIKVNA